MSARRIITVPRALMMQTACDWDIDWRERSAGEGTDGSDQTVGAGAARFIGTSDLSISNDALRFWRAARTSARGRTNVFRLPMVDPVGWGGMTAAEDSGTTFSEGETFSNGEPFAYSPAAKALATASAGASHIDLDWPVGLQAPQQSMILSYHDWPMMVTEVIPLSAFSATYRLTVERLAVTVPQDAMVNLFPTGLFRLADSRSGAMGYQAEMIAEPSFSFVEWVTR